MARGGECAGQGVAVLGQEVCWGQVRTMRLVMCGRTLLGAWWSPSESRGGRARQRGFGSALRHPPETPRPVSERAGFMPSPDEKLQEGMLVPRLLFSQSSTCFGAASSRCLAMLSAETEQRRHATRDPRSPKEGARRERSEGGAHAQLRRTWDGAFARRAREKVPRGD